MAIQEIFSVPIYKIKLDLNVKKLESFCNKYQHENTGRVVSGIYFWVVESLDPASTGKIQKGTLAVVK